MVTVWPDRLLLWRERPNVKDSYLTNSSAVHLWCETNNQTQFFFSTSPLSAACKGRDNTWGLYEDREQVHSGIPSPGPPLRSSPRRSGWSSRSRSWWWSVPLGCWAETPHVRSPGPRRPSCWGLFYADTAASTGGTFDPSSVWPKNGSAETRKFRKFYEPVLFFLPPPLLLLLPLRLFLLVLLFIHPLPTAPPAAQRIQTSLMIFQDLFCECF